MIKAGDARGAESVLRALLPKLNFAAPHLRFVTYSLLAVCDQEKRDPQAAFADLIAAGGAEPMARDGNYWKDLARTAVFAKKYEAAANAFTTLFAADRSSANPIDISMLQKVILELSKYEQGAPYRLALLESLWRVKYTPADAMGAEDAQELWFELFKMYADRAENEKAAQILPAIDRPWLIIGLRADNRYRRFTEGIANLGGGTETNERYVANRRLLASSHPREVNGEWMVADALTSIDHLAEALVVLDGILKKVAAAPPDNPAFDDLQENLRWVYDSRTRILARLGRWDEVLVSQTTARNDALKNGDDIVSQKINLADYLFRLQRPADALDEIKDLSPGMSIYGEMEAEETRACSYAQLGDRERLKASLALMHQHQREAPSALRTALQCANDQDGLAAMIIERLDAPLTRNSELIIVQSYVTDPYPTDFDRKMNERWKSVLARADVRAAIARYGVVASYPVYSREH